MFEIFAGLSDSSSPFHPGFSAGIEYIGILHPLLPTKPKQRLYSYHPLRVSPT